MLQAATVAVQQCAEEAERDDTAVWGHRDAWFRFEPLEVSAIIPVSLRTISTLNSGSASNRRHLRDRADAPARRRAQPQPDAQRGA